VRKHLRPGAPTDPAELLPTLERARDPSPFDAWQQGASSPGGVALLGIAHRRIRASRSHISTNRSPKKAVPICILPGNGDITVVRTAWV
jgi:hypothetical protein